MLPPNINYRTLFTALIIFFSCNDPREEIPKEVIARDSMVQLMADIHVAEAKLLINSAYNYKRDLRAAYMREVLTKASVDTSRFLTSFDFYSRHPEIFAEMYEEVITELSKRQAAMGNKP